MPTWLRNKASAFSKEDGTVVSLSIIPYGHGVDDEAVLNRNNQVTHRNTARVEAGGVATRSIPLRTAVLQRHDLFDAGATGNFADGSGKRPVAACPPM